MPIEDLKTKLVGLTPESATRVRVQSGFTEIKTAIDTPQHLFLELYTARYSEIVMAYATETDGGAQYVTVQRGMQGTAARSWPDDTCVRVIEVVDGTPCDVAEDSSALAGATVADLIALLQFLNVGDCLALDLTSAEAPKLTIKPTGVVPGVYGGAEFNAKGMLVHAPEGWPASALPTFDPCCDGGS